MNMAIYKQDKSGIIAVYNLEIESNGKNHFVSERKGAYTYELGCYKSEARAKEVIKAIWDSWGNGFYEMPIE